MNDKNDKCHIQNVMASALADNEDFQKQLLQRWGFTKDGGIDVKNQLKIFEVLDWIRDNGNKQHLP